MKKNKILISFLVFVLILGGGYSHVGAQNDQGGGSNTEQGGGSNNEQGGGSNSGDNKKLPNPFKGGDSLIALLKTIIQDILMPVGGVLAVLAFIYTGFLYVTAQGDEKQISKAHRALLYTAVGTALLLGAWMFASVICNTIGKLGGPICPTL